MTNHSSSPHSSTVQGKEEWKLWWSRGVSGSIGEKRIEKCICAKKGLDEAPYPVKQRWFVNQPRTLEDRIPQGHRILFRESKHWLWSVTPLNHAEQKEKSCNFIYQRFHEAYIGCETKQLILGIKAKRSEKPTDCVLIYSGTD